MAQVQSIWKKFMKERMNQMDGKSIIIRKNNNTWIKKIQIDNGKHSMVIISSSYGPNDRSPFDMRVGGHGNLFMDSQLSVQ